MPNPRRKVKDEFWFGALFVAIVIYALLIEWWKTHAVLGWTILGILVAVAGYILYRYASVRGWLGRQVKDTVQKVVFEKVASDREPLSLGQRDAILRRAQNRCENELCSYQGKPHIHHIDMNNQNNNLNNLIALCPSCHQRAHDGKFAQTQLFNWARRDYNRLQATRPQDNWRRAAIPNPTITGYCIRCGKSIAYNSKAPYCPDCYSVWVKFKDPDYEEEFCHLCGTRNKLTTMNRPLCNSCYRKSHRD